MKHSKKNVAREYSKYRAEGMSPKQAIAAARNHLEFERLADKDIVRIVANYEQESHDASYVDTWGFSDKKAEREKEKIADMIDRDGLYFYVSEYRASPKHEWETADSIGDVIGKLDSGCESDLMGSAVEAYEKSRPSRRTTSRHSR